MLDFENATTRRKIDVTICDKRPVFYVFHVPQMTVLNTYTLIMKRLHSFTCNKEIDLENVEKSFDRDVLTFWRWLDHSRPDIYSLIFQHYLFCKDIKNHT